MLLHRFGAGTDQLHKAVAKSVEQEEIGMEPAYQPSPSSSVDSTRELSLSDHHRHILSSSPLIIQPVPQRIMRTEMIRVRSAESEVASSTLAQVGARYSPVPPSQKDENEAWRAWVRPSSSLTFANDSSTDGHGISPGISELPRNSLAGTHGQHGRAKAIHRAVPSCSSPDPSNGSRHSPDRDPLDVGSKSTEIRSDIGSSDSPYDGHGASNDRMCRSPESRKSQKLADNEDRCHSPERPANVFEVFGGQKLSKTIQDLLDEFRRDHTKALSIAEASQYRIPGVSELYDSQTSHIGPFPTVFLDGSGSVVDFNKTNVGVDVIRNLGNHTEIGAIAPEKGPEAALGEKQQKILLDQPPGLTRSPSNNIAHEVPGPDDDPDEAWKKFVFADDSSDTMETTAFEEARREAARFLRPSSPDVTAWGGSSTVGGARDTLAIGSTRESSDMELSDSCDTGPADVDASLSLRATIGSPSCAFESSPALDDRLGDDPRVTWANMGPSTATNAGTADLEDEHPSSDAPISTTAHLGASDPIEVLSELVSLPSMIVEPPRSPVGANSSMGGEKGPQKFSRPKLFVGSKSNSTPSKASISLSSSVKVPRNRGRRGRPSKKAREGRLDIQALPNYKDDPIEDFREDESGSYPGLFGSLEME
ncbi:hypothetical protein GQ53DRAFT_111013 [Thozetella sp. PMI_491]|nr:hypothetical protein GQ53DRAFT_111013 [Thozetella sp. PMI_491]